MCCFSTNLDRVFPDARFVMTHRDPTDVILSVADVYADIIAGFTDHIDRHYIGRLNVEHWSLGMQRALQFRDRGADDRFYDIDFRAMQADPIGRVKGLYAWLGEPVGDEFENPMRSWWTAAVEQREPSSRADPDEFGLNLGQMRPLFARYVECAARWT
jgi:Sulfotransferase family